jgi:hypothetical protein
MGYTGYKKTIFSDIQSIYIYIIVGSLQRRICALEDRERSKTVRPKRAKQQPHSKIMPVDYVFCPHCKGSFSFAKLGNNFKCKWCHKDVRTSGRLA